MRDLDDILEFIELHYPAISVAFEERLRAIERRIGSWPKSAEEVAQRPGVRVVPCVRYPYRLFYRIADDVVEVLHINHGARQEPWERND